MKFATIVSLVLMTLPSPAQKIWFQDEFNDNSKGWLWSDYDGPEVTRKIADGKYTIHHKNDRIYWTLARIWTDRTKDYFLQADLVQIEGSDANGFGLLVLAPENKYYYFIINPLKGAWWLGTEQKGVWKALNPAKDWTKSPLVNPQKQVSQLSIQRKGDNLIFMINGTEVFSTGLDPDFRDMIAVDYFGIVTCAPMKIEIDNFLFKQDNEIHLVPNLPSGLKKVNLGPTVNSKFIEKTPVIAPDGKTLFFTVQGDPTSIAGSDDIYYATSTNDTTWNQKKDIGQPLNNVWPNSVISVAPDNNSVVLMHTYNPDGTPKAAGISMSTKTNEGWSVPRDIQIDNYYNKGRSNEFCMSANREVFIMAIQRDDSYGSNDLYVSFLKEGGNYSTPMNLGSSVNTPLWEASPFLAADGVSLYFSTYGYPGYGSADIFVTKRLDSTWTKWSEPLNLGPDINSSSWEAYYSIPASGLYAYVVSEKNSLGGIDIFRIKLPEALKPRPVVLIYGKVMNGKTKEPLEADITYNFLTTNRESGIATSNVKDGSYKIVLPAGEKYSFLARKNDFYSVSENIDVRDLKMYQEIERNLYLAPVEVGETILLNNLFFDFNKSELRQESTAELDRMAALLLVNKEMVVEISGHTDNVGGDAYNQKLSVDRANAVKLYLVRKGTTGDRIRAVGYGKGKPTGPNDTEAGRQRNRRVEFTILKK